jgi:hypothetical protein
VTIVVDPTTGHVDPPGTVLADHVLDAAGELAGGRSSATPDGTTAASSLLGWRQLVVPKARRMDCEARNEADRPS